MTPRILDSGETALVVEFGEVIDPALNARVLALDAALSAGPPHGLVECVPTYRSLMVHYDPLILPRAELVKAIERALDAPMAAKGAGRLWTIPACYDPEFAEDMDHICAATGLDRAQVVRAHASAHYTVTMYGFAPGWAYLGGLPSALSLPRRASPRAVIPAGSLIIAGGQAIVATMPMPSGWHILGRTPERLFRPEGAQPFPIRVGDVVTFAPIDRAAFAVMQRQATEGALLSSSVPS
jgi:KipI family sensor histidine kinase inhibitor